MFCGDCHWLVGSMLDALHQLVAGFVFRFTKRLSCIRVQSERHDSQAVSCCPAVAPAWQHSVMVCKIVGCGNIIACLCCCCAQELLDEAESQLVEGAARLCMPVQLIRKTRSVGVVPTQATIYEVGQICNATPSVYSKICGLCLARVGGPSGWLLELPALQLL